MPVPHRGILGTSLPSCALACPVRDITCIARNQSWWEELRHRNLQMLQIRASPADPIVSHLPAPSTHCICNKAEQPSSKCYAELCIFPLWLHSAMEFQKWSTYVILLNLGRSAASDCESRKDRFLTGCGELSISPKQERETCGRLSRGEWFWTRKRGSQPGVVGLIDGMQREFWRNPTSTEAAGAQNRALQAVLKNFFTGLQNNDKNDLKKIMRFFMKWFFH